MGVRWAEPICALCIVHPVPVGITYRVCAGPYDDSLSSAPGEAQTIEQGSPSVGVARDGESWIMGHAPGAGRRVQTRMLIGCAVPAAVVGAMTPVSGGQLSRVGGEMRPGEEE